MKNKYKIFESQIDNKKDIIFQLSNKLNKGHLTYLLGAGVSRAFGLPSWDELIEKACSDLGVPIENDFPIKNFPKRYTSLIKDKKIEKNDYYEYVRELLYDGVSFDFSIAKKEMLIAITSLLFGKKRGNIKTIITYNYDSLIEWFLELNGFTPNVLANKDILSYEGDVSIFHIHGYLPSKDLLNHSDSEFLIFSKEDFEDRMITKNDYWKELFYMVLARNVFFSVGVSPRTIKEDICPFIREVEKTLENNNIKRGISEVPTPFGYAIVSKSEFNQDFAKYCLEHGIICFGIEHDEIPSFIFEVGKKAKI